MDTETKLGSLFSIKETEIKINLSDGSQLQFKLTKGLDSCNKES